MGPEEGEDCLAAWLPGSWPGCDSGNNAKAAASASKTKSQPFLNGTERTLSMNGHSARGTVWWLSKGAEGIAVGGCPVAVNEAGRGTFESCWTELAHKFSSKALQWFVA